MKFPRITLPRIGFASGKTLVGGSPFPTFNAAFSLVGEVPEPASLWVLGAGLVGMGFFGWQRSRRGQSSA